jgi:hypothetical protein
MWAAGAVCFFAAWGKTGAIETNAFFSFELIFSLILLMILGDILIVNPVIRLASGKRALGEAKSSSAFLTGGLFHAAKISFIMLLIVITYYFLNILLIRILNLDTQSIPVPLEPLLFGILYGLYYLFLEVTGKFLLIKVVRLK